MKEKPEQHNSDAIGGSVQRMVSHVQAQSTSTQNESELLQASEVHQDGKSNGNAANLPSCIDHSLSLPQVLNLMECPKTGMLDDLARTSPQREEALALLNLWQSLGRPASGFWQETRVFVNQLILASRKMANIV